LVATLYYLGFLQYTIDKISVEYQLPRSEIFTKIETALLNSNTLIQQERQISKELMLDSIYRNARWGRQMFGKDDALWLFDSASAIIYQQNFDQFYFEVENILIQIFDKEFIKQCLIEQKQIVKQIDNDDPEFKHFCQVNYWWGRKVGAWKTDYVPKF
jgi:hypothetical protein